jgi:hypothetical protein
MTMSKPEKPLREQVLGYRPRILVNVSTLGKYHVEYIGNITQEHCGASYPTLQAAMDYAWIVGARQAWRAAA